MARRTVPPKAAATSGGTVGSIFSDRQQIRLALDEEIALERGHPPAAFERDANRDAVQVIAWARRQHWTAVAASLKQEWPVDAAGPVDAQNAPTSSLENAQNAFPTATTGHFLTSILASFRIVHCVRPDP